MNNWVFRCCLQIATDMWVIVWIISFVCSEFEELESENENKTNRLEIKYHLLGCNDNRALKFEQPLKLSPVRNGNQTNKRIKMRTNQIFSLQKNYCSIWQTVHYHHYQHHLHFISIISSFSTWRVFILMERFLPICTNEHPCLHFYHRRNVERPPFE